MFSALLHFCVQAVSNHYAVPQSGGDLSSLIDSCTVSGVATVGGTQHTANPACDWLIMHDIACLVTANFSVLTYTEIIRYWPIHA